jgi:hypothetical protein
LADNNPFLFFTKFRIYVSWVNEAMYYVCV